MQNKAQSRKSRFSKNPLKYTKGNNKTRTPILDNHSINVKGKLSNDVLESTKADISSPKETIPPENQPLQFKEIS